jgi:hypothetical protein
MSWLEEQVAWATVSPLIVPTIYPFRLHSTPNITKSLLIPVEIYVHFINYPTILITSPAVILNSPNNSFCPLSTVQVLTSDNFLPIIPPAPPLLPSSTSFTRLLLLELPRGAIFTVCSQTHSLIEKNLCESRNVSIMCPCGILVNLRLSSVDLLNFR